MLLLVCVCYELGGVRNFMLKIRDQDQSTNRRSWRYDRARDTENLL